MSVLAEAERSWWQLAVTLLRRLGSAKGATGHTRWAGAWFGIAIACGVLASGCAVGLAAAAAWLIARAAEHPPILTLLVAIVAVRAFGLGRGVFRYLERLVGHDAALRWLARLRVRAYERFEAQATGPALTDTKNAEIRQRLVRDVDAVPDLLLRVVLPAVVTVLVAAGTTAVVAALAPMAGLIVCVAVVIALAGVPWLTRRVSARAEARIVAERSDLAVATDELLSQAPELLAYDADTRALDDVAATDGRLRRAELTSAWSEGLGAALVVLSVGVACWGAAVAGIDALHAGTLSSVGLAVVVLTPLALADVLAALPGIAGLAARSGRALSRVVDVCECPASNTQRPDAPAPDLLDGQNVPALTPPYDVCVSGLAARWAPDRPEVFTDMSFTLPAGGRIAVVGPSGAGKSTLAQILIGFLAPSGGSVSIAGVDCAGLPGERIRSVVGLCTQSAYVFDTTIAENVRLARPSATDEQVRDALARVRLLRWVEALPTGIATPVGEHGDRLSGGERQRLALARCLLADTPIVVLDEPTEHLDAETAASVTADLLDAATDRSVVLITHRAADLALVDEVAQLSPSAGPTTAAPTATATVATVEAARPTSWP